MLFFTCLAVDYPPDCADNYLPLKPESIRWTLDKHFIDSCGLLRKFRKHYYRVNELLFSTSSKTRIDCATISSRNFPPLRSTIERERVLQANDRIWAPQNGYLDTLSFNLHRKYYSSSFVPSFRVQQSGLCTRNANSTKVNLTIAKCDHRISRLFSLT